MKTTAANTDRTALVHHSRALSPTIMLACQDPVHGQTVKGIVISLLTVSEQAVTGKTVLEDYHSDEVNIHPDNLGLVLEEYNSRTLYVASGCYLTGDKLKLLTDVLLKHKDKLLYHNGGTFERLPDVPNKHSNVPVSKLTVQFSDTHRMTIIADARFGDYLQGTDGTTTNLNPYGIKICFVPNEYKSKYSSKDKQSKPTLSNKYTYLFQPEQTPVNEDNFEDYNGTPSDLIPIGNELPL